MHIHQIDVVEWLLLAKWKPNIYWCEYYVFGTFNLYYFFFLSASDGSFWGVAYYKKWTKKIFCASKNKTLNRRSSQEHTLMVSSHQFKEPNRNTQIAPVVYIFAKNCIIFYLPLCFLALLLLFHSIQTQ